MLRLLTRDPKALQQILSNVQIQIAIGVWVDVVSGTVKSISRAAVSKLRVRAGQERLAVLRRVRLKSSRSGVGIKLQREIALRRGLMLESLRRRYRTGSRLRRLGSVAGPRCLRRSPLPSRSPPSPTALTLTPSRLTLVGPGAMGCPMSRRNSAALSAPQHLARQIGAIALDGDIDVIFERQRDYVLRRSDTDCPRESANPGATYWSAWRATPRASPREKAEAGAPPPAAGRRLNRDLLGEESRRRQGQ